jgi:hypothetical protein
MYQLLFLLFGLQLPPDPHENRNSGGNDPDLINDGPYIYQINNKLKVGWIENSVYREDYIAQDNFNVIGSDFNLSCNYKDLTNTYLLKPDYNQVYTNVDSIGVITDIHGQYGIYIDLLRETGIIDEKLNWNFGKGHFVVLGDMFDRGNMVTEVLWHLFGLERQAEKAGGKVHVLLGNHEFMVLRNDLCDINEKYGRVEEISKTGYADLYSEKSVLGKWLRSKPVVITIDNIIFVHGGISREMIQRNLHFKQINRLFTNNIIGKNQWDVHEEELLKFLNEASGPLWYRGYFYDPDFCESEIDSILDFYGKKHIVVGHTPNETITSLFDNKILGADTGIAQHKPGEILIYKDGAFYKCINTGCRVKL